MKHGNDPVAGPDAAEAIFSAKLTPHRSLKPAGFALVMGVLAAMAFAVSTAFWAIGAWPIVGFLGLDVLAVYIAFQANYRAARAFETVEVTPDSLTIRKVAANGEGHEYHFNPYWARLEIEREEDRGVTRLQVTSHGRKLDVGRFLSPNERGSFATAFSEALAAARTPALEPVQETGRAEGF